MSAQAQTQQNTGANPQAPGALFGLPKLSTRSRFVPDAANESISGTPLQGQQQRVQTTRFDQLDIVKAWKLNATVGGTFTQGNGQTVHASPFGCAAAIQSINVKLQAAYDTTNLTGPLAALIQGYRPVWGSRVPSQSLATTDPFAAMTPFTVNGAPSTQTVNIDMPVAIKIDEYYNLTASGDPQQRIMDALVSPAYMASQARTVIPSIVTAPMMGAGDALGSPTTIAVNDATSSFTAGTFSGGINRDAFWTSNNPAANPIQYPWLYTRSYFQQPTQGQNKVGVLIQNTGVSVGQVLSLFGFVWDPDANSGFGAIVPFSSIQSFEIVTGGTLQNLYCTPLQLENMMFTQHPQLDGVGAWAQGAFVFDYALSPDGAYLTNANAINTYVLNGVSVNITFNSGQQPGSNATVYLGVEALKLVTS